MLSVSRPPATLPIMAKVTIIGAGSVEFTRNILADLCSYEELHGILEVALHDIDAERLAYLGARGRSARSSRPARATRSPRSPTGAPPSTAPTT